LIISTTRFGFFVELEDLFIEGLVPLDTLPGDRYMYHENVRKIIGERSRRQYSIGDHVRVRLDRVDGVEKKLQFSVVGSQAPTQNHERQRVVGNRVARKRAPVNRSGRKPKRHK
jgi:DNA-directed RNA polymerase subunit E'/Rpb7